MKNVTTKYAMTLEGEIDAPAAFNNRPIFKAICGSFACPNIAGEMQDPASD